MKAPTLFIVCLIFAIQLTLTGNSACADENPHRVVYEGTAGPGAGKHIVFIAGDHEYRGEETLPALARILAHHYGFKCSVFITTDPETGYIKPGSSHISGLEALKEADLMVLFLRFQHFPNEQMQHIVDYLERGGPIVALRTSTHAFKIESGPYQYLTWNNKDVAYTGGFGRQILGETWVSHYGTNHKQSSRLLPEKGQADHPVLRGVENVHVQSGGYTAYPKEDSTTLMRGEILNGMQADSPADPKKEILPVVWTRNYQSDSGVSGRVLTTTHGASEDLLNDGFRRLMVNGILWAGGLEQEIKADNPIEFVGPYTPVGFAFEGYRKGVKPSDLAGWESPISPSK